MAKEDEEEDFDLNEFLESDDEEIDDIEEEDGSLPTLVSDEEEQPKKKKRGRPPTGWGEMTDEERKRVNLESARAHILKQKMDPVADFNRFTLIQIKRMMKKSMKQLEKSIMECTEAHKQAAVFKTLSDLYESSIGNQASASVNETEKALRVNGQQLTKEDLIKLNSGTGLASLSQLDAMNKKLTKPTNNT